MDAVAGTEPVAAGLPVRRVLLTGATGRVGARFLPRLKQLGAETRLMVWSPGPGVRRSATMIVGDLADAGACRAAVEGADAVVHIAAAFQGLRPDQSEDVNFQATRQLATAARDAGVRRFVQLSSSLVYADGAGAAAEDTPVRESAAASFPAAKLGAERALSAVRGLESSVLRLAFTYGEGDPHLAEAIGWARRGGTGRMHLVHHADVRQAILCVLSAPELPRRVYNVADDRPVGPAELLAAAPGFAVRGQVEEGAVTETEPGAQPFGRVLTAEAIRQELGFAPGFPSIAAAAEKGAL
ncbi:NAD(P)-dependent oxidoreductase [Amycolatopsis rubida]|uniref:NAD(P)-dependent oxidoreductase n=1 Tax=Amycolatopsis rubida TaxID=112413 RepID=A0ABX0BXT0_9PSEU|nr:NAD(P)-dependent oxidoreductase [Amycolatopsis rubida]MYW93110.1 NAD-dependent epimerase/dehydratase family protein [Amycolatopsis rubida]NEC58097.1 NAD(P)-dependent oxidoreductase [Amycolatopsis rubida]